MSYVAVVGAVVAALGAATQYQTQRDASKRQQRLIQENLQRQQGYQQQAEQAALARAQEFAPETRQDKQQQLEQEATQQLIRPVEQAAPAMQDQSAVQGAVSSDYTAARAKSQAAQMRDANALASILGKITGAGRLRTNEALDMAETGQFIDRLKSFSSGQNSAAQVGISRAGQPDGGAMLLGGLMQAGGTAALAGGLGGGAGGSAWSGSGITPGAGGTGFTGLGQTGLRLPVLG